jgi:hypothetical protein
MCHTLKQQNTYYGIFKKTTDVGILFKKKRQNEVTSYTNVDWARDTKS